MTDTEINEQVAWGLGPNRKKYCEQGQVDDDIIPDYCHDIKAAWEVVEFVESKGFLFQIDNHQDKEHGLWTAEFLDQNIEIEADDSADTAPMAICLAFLQGCHTLSHL